MSDTSAVHGTSSPCNCKDCDNQYKGERARLDQRRKTLSLQDSDNWGLALSGGGIRSATFCLGVLQAMARTEPPPGSSAEAPSAPVADAPPSGARPARERLLARFDYLSTVSGGGYIGAFFCSLFQVDRLRPSDNDEDTSNRCKVAAERAYSVLDHEPPGRIRSGKNYEHAPLGEGPMAWLRENGRYLTPSGAGDMLYGVALATRNWLSMHFVVGMPILALLVALALLQLLFRTFALSVLSIDEFHFWDSLWWLPVLVAWLWLAPCALAFWLEYSTGTADTQAPKLWNISVGCCLAALLAILWLIQQWWNESRDAPWSEWSFPPYILLAGIAAVAIFASLVWGLCCIYAYVALNTSAPFGWNLLRIATVVGVVATVDVYWCWGTGGVANGGEYPPGRSLGELLWVGGYWGALLGLERWLRRAHPLKSADRTVRGYRVRVSRWLANGIALTLLMTFLFIADLLTAYLWQYEWKFSAAAVLAACIWAVRSIASFTDEKSWLRKLFKLPIATISAVAGMLLLLLLFVCWGVLLRWIRSGCSDGGLCANSLEFMVILLVVSVALAAFTGLFVGFINLSSLQALYSSRLTRAYLGASNFLRFKWNEDAEVRIGKLSVSEALQGDDMSLEQYYGNGACPPLHLVNVTVNLTVDPAERLVQRDRQGLPMCIAPSEHMVEPERQSGPYTFIVDGMPKRRTEYAPNAVLESEIEQPLTIGHWIATSGAAVSTGLGRQTSMGLSLLLGLANVRLGTWWPARFSRESVGGASGTRTPWYAKVVPTHSLLFDEFFARFHGLNREYLYLSDGGHFENTAAYELLRPERKLRLIVVCDCGADPLYQFGDLANLIRLARLDLGLEIEADSEFDRSLKYRNLNKVIGYHRDFVGGGRKLGSNEPITLVDDQCALLFNVYDCDNSTRNLKCMLLVIKPNLITRMNDDVWHYAQLHPEFPNEPTADQFFDEAQFESYRQLGLNMGELLFGGGASGSLTYARLLWGYLDMKFKRMK
jgi:hypothetical protein